VLGPDVETWLHTPATSGAGASAEDEPTGPSRRRAPGICPRSEAARRGRKMNPWQPVAAVSAFSSRPTPRALGSPQVEPTAARITCGV
jgi:hypothetical protein